jgi:protein TonB
MERRRATFWTVFFISALVHIAVIAVVRVPPPRPPSPAQEFLVTLPPAPQPEIEPQPNPAEDVLPEPVQPVPVQQAQPEVEELAIPDPDIQIEEYEPPIMTTPPPQVPPPSQMTLPVIPQKAVPGDPSNEAIVRAWLERFKRYPRIAVVRKMEGEVLLYLKLAPDGTVLKMVQRASPFPLRDNTDLPTEYLVPIEFRMQR